MDKKLQLEAIKALMDGVKAKLLLFSGGFGGVIALVFKYFSAFTLLLGSFVGVILFTGILINLVRLNRLMNEIERIEIDT